MFNKKIIKKQLAKDFDALLLLPCTLEKAVVNKWLCETCFSESFTFVSSGRSYSGAHLLQLSCLFMLIGIDWTIGWERIHETGRTRDHNGAAASLVASGPILLVNRMGFFCVHEFPPTAQKHTHVVLTGNFELTLGVTGGWRAVEDVPLLLTGNTRDSSNTLMTFIRRAEFNEIKQAIDIHISVDIWMSRTCLFRWHSYI